MKIEKKEAAFEPVTITLQSQDELDLFLDVFHRVGGTKVVEILGSTSTIPRELRKVGAVHRNWDMEGDIYIKE